MAMERAGNTAGYPPKFWVLSLLLLSAVAIVAYVPEQSDFKLIIGPYALAFAACIFIYRAVSGSRGLSFFLGLAVLLRLAMLPAFPNLSDDIYRFIWDGRLLLNGINPFNRLPVDYMQLAERPPGLTEELFAQLNSPEYFTIYPPVAQGVFALACWLFPQSIMGATLIIKVFLLACELGSLRLLPRLLKKLGFPEKGALLYALNPLVIVEVVGNLHFEGAMVFFLLLALWWLAQGRWLSSAVAMAFSVASKLLPLLFLMFFIRRLGWRRSLAYFAVLGAVVVLLFVPLLGSAFFSGFGSSLRLYFQRFEFNASIYYLIRWIGYQKEGYNLIKTIGPALALCTFSGITLAALLEKKSGLRSLPAMMLLAICLYLAFTPTVHPWYTILPLLLAPFTHFRFPVLWTGLVYLTYINYSYPEYHENLWVVGMEYLLVYAVAAWEWWKGRGWM